MVRSPRAGIGRHGNARVAPQRDAGRDPPVCSPPVSPIFATTMPALAAPSPDELLLNGARLKAALVAGCRRVLSRRDYLNQINVFPVPDGDTGSNLAFTLTAVLKCARGDRGGDVGSVLSQVAREAVDGARGNSGAIFAQFFHGLAEALGGRRDADAATLAAAASAAAASARTCLAQPREGTILSVIHDFAAELRSQADRGIRNLTTLFAIALDRARGSLADTPRQLPVLRAAGVVDAGAAGFVDFLEGIQDYIEHGRSALRLPPELRDLAGGGHAEVHLESVETASLYRYCTECLLTGDHLDVPAVRTRLSELPLDSLVVAGGGQRLRIHAHLDTPNQLFQALIGLGEVSQRKADDMQAQARLRAAPFQPVRIACDSAADLPSGQAERLGIAVIPVRVNFGDEDFLDRITLSPSELYSRLRKDPSPARTSQPPPGDFRRAYELLLGHSDDIVSIQVSSRLSGTFQAALGAAREVDDRHIEVVDSLTVSAGQALIAMTAAECASRGSSRAEVLEAIHVATTQTQVYGLIPDLRYGVAGGRIPALVKRIAELFGLYVLVTERSGKVKPFRALRGRRRLVERYADVIAGRARGNARWRAIVGHCDAGDDAATLAAALRERISGLDPIWVTEAGPAIGAHAGPGTLIVGLQPLPASAPKETER